MSRKYLFWNDDNESWDRLSHHNRSRRSGGEWEDDRSEFYVFQNGEYRPVEDYVTPWCENAMFARPGVSTGNLAGNRGTHPYYTESGTMVGTSSTPIFSGLNPTELREGNGYALWGLTSPNELFIRVYLRASAGTVSSYERRLISVYSDKEIISSQTRILSIVKKVSLGGNPTESNQFQFVVNDEPVLDRLGMPIETPPGSFPYNSWVRLEININRTKGVRFRIFDDPHSHTPSSASSFDFPDGYHLPPLRSFQFGESDYQSGPNKRPTRVQHLALGTGGWIGPVENPGSMLSQVGNRAVNNNSTTAPLPQNSVKAGEYVVLSVLYTDAHNSNAMPHITPPAGFTRLGFEYVGRNSTANHRTLLLVYGRYFDTNHTSSKQFSVGGGRSGHWLINQRHYTNVHPEHPIAVGWDGETNYYLSPNTYRVRHIRPPNVTEPSRGDTAVYAAITRMNSGSHTSASGWVELGVSNPRMASRSGGVGTQTTYNGRLNLLLTDDQWLYGVDSHPLSGFTLNENRSGGREGFGRIVLRQNKELDFTPDPVADYPIPSVLQDAFGGIGDAPPEPDPDPDPIYETITTTWNRTWYATYDNGGLRGGDLMYQGRFSANRGYAHSYIGFNHNSIQSALDGAVVSSARLWLHNAHFYYSTGGSAIIGTHSYTGVPPSTPVSHRYGRISEHFNYGQSKWVTITGAMVADLRSGSARGITLGRSNGGNLSQYGYFYCGNASSVRLRITYRKQVN